MRHQNRSVPALPTQHRSSFQDYQAEPFPAMPPPYDPTDVLDSFTALYINDPEPGTTSLPAPDPVARTGTSMSMRPQQPPSQHRMPAQRPSLPASPEQAVRRMPPGRPQRTPHSMDGVSVHSRGSVGSYYTNAVSDGAESLAYDAAETDGTSLYSYSEDPHAQRTSSGFSHMDQVQYQQHPHAPPQNYPPQQWRGQHPQYPGYAPAPPPPQNAYNPLYAAASNVLGMGPPPGGPPPPGPPMQAPYPGRSSSPMPPPGPGPGYAPPPQNYYPNGQGPTLSASQSNPYFPPVQQYQGGPPSTYSVATQGSVRGPPSIAPQREESEFELRPEPQRTDTKDSVHPRTQKIKAVDLSAPPYTKEYIDQYRQRIKDDPDPEAHFGYAKYLIDAAKHIGANAKDQRSVKRYRDTLIAESLKVIRRLATQGVAYDEAQFFLANCHGTGTLGLQVDHERAYHLYLQAAKQNHPAASYRVAVCNEIGAGTRREPQRAAAFYRKAASLGDTAAMYKLGVILLRGSLGEQPNPREAVGWLKRAAEQADEENPHALHELALLHEQPGGQVVQYDPAYSKELYTRAAHLGYTHSQYKLGQCFEYGTLTCPVDPRRSIAWYTKAAEKGHSEAELALSGWYLTGSEGVLKQSDSEAYLWARRAANKGLSKAEYAVGYYAEVGIGIKQDVEFAKRWYMRAAGEFASGFHCE